MPFAERRLTNPTTLSTVASTVYTVPSQYTTIVKQVVVTNTTASPASFNLYIGSATSANAIFSNTTISANDSLIINLSQVLSSLEILTASANANSAVNMTISGVENNGPLDPANVYIADGAITTSKLANSSVTSTKIAANAVTNTAILDDAVSTAKIANSAITTDKIAANAVVTADIANNAVTQAKLSTDVPLSGFRNIIINGDMRINQRGGSYTGVGYTLDRWYMGVTGAYTVSQSSSSPPTGFQNFMRVQRTNGSSNTGVPQITQSLETRDSIQFQGKSVTVSFYARAGANYSPSGNVLNWRIYGGTGTDQNVFSYTGQATPVDQSVVLTTSWQRFTYTVSSLTSYNEYGLFFFCSPTGTAGANDYFDITGIQMEIGSQATPFEQRPYGVELALCQRYYEHNYGTGYAVGSAAAYPYNQPHTGINGYTVANQQKFLYSLYMVPKRRVPDITIYDTAGNNGKLTTLDAGGTGTTNVTVGISSTTDKMIGYAPSAGTYAGYVYFYVASAEL